MDTILPRGFWVVLAIALEIWCSPSRAREPQPKAVLKGHDDTVWSIAFSPDGKWLASAGRDGQAFVWEIDTGKKLVSLKGHEYTVSSIEFSPNGRMLATASDSDETVRLWDAVTGKQLFTQPFQSRLVRFSPDGKTLAAGGYDEKVGGRIRLWDVESGKERATLNGVKSGVQTVAFSPDGKLLVSGHWDRSVVIWDLAASHQVSTLKPSISPIWSESFATESVVFSQDGKHLAASDRYGVVTVWEVGSKRLVASIRGPERGIGSIALNPDGTTLAVAGFDSAIRLYDLPTGNPRAEVDGQVDAIHTLAYAPDGKTLSVGGSDGTVKFWEVAALVGRFERVEDRIKRRLRSDEYSVEWGTPPRFSPDAELEIAAGIGHLPADFDWLRFRPAKDGVDVLCVELIPNTESNKSTWEPDRPQVRVRKARMKSDDYAALLRKLAVVASAQLKKAENAPNHFGSGDFWAQARLTADKKEHLDLEWAGYAMGAEKLDSAKPYAATELARHSVHWLDFQDHKLTDEERAWASAKFARDWKQFGNKEFHWWVWERYLQMIGVIGDRTALPILCEILAKDPPKGRPNDAAENRPIYYAINAATRLIKTDVRDKPVEEMDIEKTRRKVLELLRDMK